MPIRIKKPEKLARVATVATLAFMVCWGLAMVVSEIKPFWVDEWRVIYNLKFKDAAGLWGPLDYMQQFPRVYLGIIKVFTAAFDYSYTALRVPSYIAGTVLILFGYRLMNKIYSREHLNKFLFIMILVSASTFTDYYVQIKQYTMDLLLGLVALWQCIELMRLCSNNALKKGRYLLLCASFIIVPFFSYSYPIAIAPVYLVQLVACGMSVQRGRNTGERRSLLALLFPLVLCTVSVGVFYVVDVSQLMKDEGMRNYWGHLMMVKGFSWSSFFMNIYNLFAEIGSGMLFWYIFGILGIVSFLSGTYGSFKSLRAGSANEKDLIYLYSSLLIVLVIVLFIAGKFPLGEPRLNAFTIPAISILIIRQLDMLVQKQGGARKISLALSTLLLAGVTGNIYTTFIASITGDAYARKMNIYRSTERAIALAQTKKIPILITPEVAWPYDKTLNLPYNTTVPGDWVLKTFPAYHVADSISVYGIADMASLKEAWSRLPAETLEVLVGDGVVYRIVKR